MDGLVENLREDKVESSPSSLRVDYLNARLLRLVMVILPRDVSQSRFSFPREFFVENLNGRRSTLKAVRSFYR